MDKQDHESYREISTSYNEMRQTVKTLWAAKDTILDFFKDPEELVFVACGSSYWLSLSAAKTLAHHTGKQVSAVKAGDVVMHPEEYRSAYKVPTLIVPSRSGKTKELLEAVGILKKAYSSAKVFSITEYEPNELAGISDLNISLPFVNEISVCQTRSFNSLWTAFIVISSILANDRGLLDDLEQYLAQAPVLYASGEKTVKRMVAEGPSHLVVTLGSGPQYGVVIEGAYIVIEMAEMNAAYYHLMEYRHGPLVTAKKGVLVCVCSAGASSVPFEEKMAREIRARGAKVAVVGEGLGTGWYDYAFTLGAEYRPEIACLYFISVMQLLAYRLSLVNGRDPDNPGELVRYIAY
jgi:fructoselysine-6-P-deglycase FrlB-like protein